MRIKLINPLKVKAQVEARITVLEQAEKARNPEFEPGKSFEPSKP